MQEDSQHLGPHDSIPWMWQTLMQMSKRRNLMVKNYEHRFQETERSDWMEMYLSTMKIKQLQKMLSTTIRLVEEAEEPHSEISLEI